jgi:hypothetical protein
MEILKHGNYRIIHLIDGELIYKALDLINTDKADGLNLNFIRNFPAEINVLRKASRIKCITINDSSSKRDFDYSIINYLSNLERLEIYTSDKKEINFQNFPKLKEVAINWRPAAKSIYQCSNIKSLFIGKYTEKDLSKFELLRNLSYLRVNTGSLNSLTGIEKFQNLSTLMLMQLINLTDISGIENLQKLDSLIILNCKKIKNINILNKSNQITKLQILGTTPKL